MRTRKPPKSTASAYNQSREAVAFYEFTRTMQSYKTIIGENTTLVLSTDSDLFKFLKGMAPEWRSGPTVPATTDDSACTRAPMIFIRYFVEKELEGVGTSGTY